MKRIIGIAFVIIAAITLTIGQQPAPPQNAHPPSVAVAQANAEQKAKLAELAKAWDGAARAADAARDKYLIQLMATLAELGLKPSETTVTWNEKGEPVFNHVAPTTAVKPEAKP